MLEQIPPEGDSWQSLCDAARSQPPIICTVGRASPVSSPARRPPPTLDVIESGLPRRELGGAREERLADPLDMQVARLHYM